MNVGELFDRVMGLIDEHSVNGTLRTDADNIDYRLRFNRIVDRLQKDLSTVDKISANTQFTQYPFDNLYGDAKGFDLVQHKNADVTNVSATGPRSYYLEVDGPSTITVEEETSTGTWSVLETLSGTSALTTFTAYRGLITPSSTANAIRFKFGGSYPYRVRNTALFSELFAGSTYVPAYRPYVRYTMSSDFMELDRIIWEDGTTYKQLPDYYWEDPLTLCVKYDYQGSFTVFYWKYPTAISSDDTTPTTYDSTNLELSTQGQEILAYGVASELLTTDPTQKSVSVLLKNFYNEKRSELSVKIDYPKNEFMSEVNGW